MVLVIFSRAFLVSFKIISFFTKICIFSSDGERRSESLSLQIQKSTQPENIFSLCDVVSFFAFLSNFKISFFDFCSFCLHPHFVFKPDFKVSEETFIVFPQTHSQSKILSPQVLVAVTSFTVKSPNF